MDRPYLLFWVILVDLAAVSPEQTLPYRLRELGINREFLRRMTTGPDTLFSPLSPTREALYSDDPACIVLRALFCGIPVPRAELEDALGRNTDVPWTEVERGNVVCPFHVRIVRDLLLFSDYIDARADAVMGAGETTAILYDASRPDLRVRRVLDLGCGAGTLALLLARDAEKVIGTDINPRAIDMAQRNASMNGIGNVEFRTGDLYEPVGDERFDLIVSQPPYYPSTAGAERKTFLHAGERGDEIARAVVAGLPDHLEPDGRALVFASWPVDAEAIVLPGFQIEQIHWPAAEIPATRQTLTTIRPTGYDDRSLHE